MDSRYLQADTRLFLKGALPLSVPEARALWGEQRFALTTLRADVPLKASGALGEANLQAEVYAPILDALASGPVTFREMSANRSIADLGWARITQALAVLVGTGHLQPCLPATEDGKRAQRTRAFNAAVLNGLRVPPNSSSWLRPLPEAAFRSIAFNSSSWRAWRRRGAIRSRMRGPFFRPRGRRCLRMANR